MTEQSRDHQKMTEVEALEKRYAESYRLANTNEGIGNRYRILAILFVMVTAVVTLLAIMITLSFPFAIIIAFIGLIFAIYLHSMGVQIATQAQVLKIGIDNAIYASPLLNNEQKAAILAQDGKYSALDNLMVDDLWRESASYIRFFSTDTQPLTMQLLETALQQVDPIYTIDQSTNTLSKVGLLHVGDQQIGELELLREGEDAFSDEIYGFAGAVEELHHSNKSVVIEVLQNVNVIVTVHFVGDTGEKERCQAKVEPLWAWLFSNRTGLLHIENEGFY